MPIEARLTRHACRAPFVSCPGSSSKVPPVWISDDALSECFKRFTHFQSRQRNGPASRSDGGRRHGSNVPGPLEHRRRAARRTMNLSAAFALRDVGPVSVNVDLTQVFKGWIGSLWDKRNPMDWTWQAPRRKELQPILEHDVPIRLSEVGIEPKLFAGQVYAQDVKNMLEDVNDLGEIRNLRTWLHRAKLDEVVWSRLALERLLQLDPPLSDLIEFVEDTNLNYDFDKNTASLLQHVRSRANRLSPGDATRLMTHILNNLPSEFPLHSELQVVLYNIFVSDRSKRLAECGDVTKAYEALKGKLVDTLTLYGSSQDAIRNLHKTLLQTTLAKRLQERDFPLILGLVHESFDTDAWSSAEHSKVLLKSMCKLLHYQRWKADDTKIQTKDSFFYHLLNAHAATPTLSCIEQTTSYLIGDEKPWTDDTAGLLDGFLEVACLARQLDNGRPIGIAMWQRVHANLARTFPCRAFPKYFQSLGPSPAAAVLLRYFIFTDPTRNDTMETGVKEIEAEPHSLSDSVTSQMQYEDNVAIAPQIVDMGPGMAQMLEVCCHGYEEVFQNTAQQNISEWAAALMAVLQVVDQVFYNRGPDAERAYKLILELTLEMRQFDDFYQVACLGHLRMKHVQNAYRFRRVMKKYITENATLQPTKALAAFHWTPNIYLTEVPDLLPAAIRHKQVKTPEIWKAIRRYDPAADDFCNPNRIGESRGTVVNTGRARILFRCAMAFAHARHLRSDYCLTSVHNIHMHLLRYSGRAPPALADAYALAGIRRPLELLEAMASKGKSLENVESPVAPQRLQWVLQKVGELRGLQHAKELEQEFNSRLENLSKHGLALHHEKNVV